MNILVYNTAPLILNVEIREYAHKALSIDSVGLCVCVSYICLGTFFTVDNF